MTREQTPGSVFEMDITVQNNQIVVGTNGGNVNGKPLDVLKWRTPPGGQKFTLEFFQIAPEASVQARKEHAAEHIDVAELSRWPFCEPPEPAGGVVGPTNEFVGKLSGAFPRPTGFKYYVTVGNLRLDPIIIVDE